MLLISECLFILCLLNSCRIKLSTSQCNDRQMNYNASLTSHHYTNVKLSYVGSDIKMLGKWNLPSCRHWLCYKPNC